MALLLVAVSILLEEEDGRLCSARRKSNPYELDMMVSMMCASCDLRDFERCQNIGWQGFTPAKRSRFGEVWSRLERWEISYDG